MKMDTDSPHLRKVDNELYVVTREWDTTMEISNALQAEGYWEAVEYEYYSMYDYNFSGFVEVPRVIHVPGRLIGGVYLCRTREALEKPLRYVSSNIPGMYTFIDKTGKDVTDVTEIFRPTPKMWEDVL